MAQLYNKDILKLIIPVDIPVDYCRTFYSRGFQNTDELQITWYLKRRKSK